MRASWLGYESQRLLATMLARIELHRIQAVTTAEGEYFCKTRRRASRFAVSAGNLYLRMQRAGVEILHTARWLRWELAVWRAQRGEMLEGRGSPGQWLAAPHLLPKGLMLPRLPGAPLTQILDDARWSIGDRLQSIAWALQALAELHARTADWGEGLAQTISHGDATANNVIIDMSRCRAHWVDFDTRHETSLPEIVRRADDLRALIFSAALRFPQPRYNQLVAQLSSSYPSREVLAQLRRQLLSDWRRPGSYQLAQAPLPFAASEALRAEVAARLPSCQAAPPDNGGAGYL